MNEADRATLETSAQTFAAQLGVEYFDTRAPIDITPLLGKLTVEGMKAYGIVPLSLQDATLTLGISERTNRDLLPALTARLTGYKVLYRFVSQFGWERLYNRYSIAADNDILESGNFEPFAERTLNVEPKQMFEPIAQLAYQLGASDIHIEPSAASARIRFRLDGTLHPIITLPKDRYDLLTSDLQTRAGVKWGADVPQGGRIGTKVIDTEGDIIDLNMRLETVPSLHGQDVVIRLFNMKRQYLSLDSLHLTNPQRTILERAVSHPRGMVLTVGPTGSGKTSTLYSIINELNNPQVKIVTLEDPIEYELEGVSQVPVLSADQQLFTEKLRAVLREDPNVIMIGEIRDADTAKTALQAALTGHLVLSTFHASSAAAAVTRLMDMIGENPLLASAVRLLMAQRPVRKLCPECRRHYKPSSEELLQIKTALKDMPEDAQPKYAELKLYKAVGCDKCRHFGYKGRISLIEQLVVSPRMEALISGGNAATTTLALQEAAKKEGMVTLLQDGILKVVSGQTTLEEVYAAVGE